MERFEHSLGENFQRVKFLDWMPFNDFMGILESSNVVLDSFYFGGGSTAFLSFATGTPMVSWPSRFLRGRTCAGLYQRMGIKDCIAKTQEDYAEIAVKIGTHPNLRQKLKKEILKHHYLLFDNDSEGVQDFYLFLDSL